MCTDILILPRRLLGMHNMLVLGLALFLSFFLNVFSIWDMLEWGIVLAIDGPWLVFAALPISWEKCRGCAMSSVFGENVVHSIMQAKQVHLSSPVDSCWCLFCRRD